MEFLLRILGLVFLGLSVLAFPLPFPLALPLFAIGVGLLVLSSQRVRDWLTRLRRRYPVLNRALRRVNPALPKQLAHAMDETDYREAPSTES